jgi:hypothetical protein
MAKATTVYQLKVTLKHIQPAIWRRLQVSADLTFGKLHFVLQDVLGWTHSHLHQFVIGQRRIGMNNIDQFSDDLESEDEDRLKLNQVALEKSRFLYEYDFGDSWDHEILVEKVLPAIAGTRYPICLAGKRACPPEDCGGVGGYARMLEIVANPKHQEHGEMLEWLGGSFDPEAFDLNATNAILRPLSTQRAASLHA